MLKPTQDKDAFQELKTILFDYHNTEDSEMINLMLKRLEQMGYHKGLPSIIEEALNSGDGVYRP